METPPAEWPPCLLPGLLDSPLSPEGGPNPPCPLSAMREVLHKTPAAWTCAFWGSGKIHHRMGPQPLNEIWVYPPPPFGRRSGRGEILSPHNSAPKALTEPYP